MKGKLLLLIVGIVAFIFIVPEKASAGGPTYVGSRIDVPTVWTKEGSPYVVGSVGVYAPLKIEPGVIVKLKPIAWPSFRDKFEAVGTEKEPIIFTSLKDDSYGGDTNMDGDATNPSPGDWWSLGIYSGADVVIENSIVLYGGGPKSSVLGSIYIQYEDNVVIRNTEVKYSNKNGIVIYRSQATIEYCSITNNFVGVYVNNNRGQIAKMSYSIVADNNYGATAYSGFCYADNCLRFDARNNWWGDRSGPYFESFNYFGEDNLDGKGNQIFGGILFHPWLEMDPAEERKPVILVPGIGASVNLDTMVGGIMNDNWKLFSHTYDGIIEAFEEMGYEEGKDFFIAYYDWRQKNEDSASDYLEPVIKEAIAQSGASKVNVIAHSMGGLVARSYIQSDEYDNDVDHLFLIGTPNKGSSDVYPVWEGGYIPDNWENELIMDIYLAYLDMKKLTLNNYESVHNFIPSVKQLMPVYNYIFPKSDPTNIKDYLGMSEINDWLENLNDGVELLNDRVKVSVISGNEQETVNGIPVIDVDEEPLWADGKPDPIDPERNDPAGDGRVLLSSSQIDSLFSDIFNYDHGDIVSRSEQLIADRINENLETIYPAPDIPSEMGFWFASPVDVEITDPQGRVISGNVNEIPLAIYASELRPDGFKIISIPNSIDGEYEVSITGNGDGVYHFGTEYMDYGDGANDQSSILGGMIQNGEERNYGIEYDSDNPAGAVSPPRSNIDFIISDVKSLEEASLVSDKEAKFILVKLKVIQQLIERIDGKEGKDNIIGNYEEQINRQIDWLIDYINEKSENKGKGGISQEAKDILVSQLESIKY